MGHARRIASLSVPVLALSLLGTPALAGPAAAQLTCTAATLASASTGLTMAGDPADATVEIESTYAACSDTRPDNKPDHRIIGAKVEAPEPGSIKGTCGEFEAKAKLRFSWLLADGSEGQPTTLEITHAQKGEEVTSHEITADGGDLDDWDVEIAAANASEIKSQVAGACTSEEGIKRIAPQLSFSFSNNPWSRG
ncbi:hypothetical protein JOF53_001399 [Crossiella equi]|uniref:Secreted protein n=1 Tax=Crossiella equi TaxID=130796 RepID=A0ABS5A8C2_9PSEU|nr:hypothetical protein [Crossiella equi]MBP2472527.1 hypothetical protein [Crossiella equi]